MEFLEDFSDIWQDPRQRQLRSVLLLFFYVVFVLMAVSVFYHGSVGPTVDKDVTNLTWTTFEKHCGATAKVKLLLESG